MNFVRAAQKKGKFFRQTIEFAFQIGHLDKVMSSHPRTESTGSHDATWRPLPKDHPVLRRMESITIQSYKPTIISDNRRMIEDLCRDLIVNNDHIHVVEQRMRLCIDEGLGKYVTSSKRSLFSSFAILGTPTKKVP